MRSTIKTIVLFVTAILAAMGCSKDNPVEVGTIGLNKVAVYVESYSSSSADSIFYEFNRKCLFSSICRTVRMGSLGIATNVVLLDWSVENEYKYIAVLTTYSYSDSSSLVLWLRKRDGDSWSNIYCGILPVKNQEYFLSTDSAAELLKRFMSDSLASDTTASTTLELVPEIIYEAPLVYSNLRGSQGTVILSVKVDSDGFVENAIVSRSSGFEDLDLAAVSCLYGWRFKPAFSAEKRPVPVWVMIPITYIYP